MFTAAAEAYDSFMGRYSGPLAPLFCDFAGIEPGTRVVDVGCGPGALIAELVRRLGADAVSAADPAEQFVAAAKKRYPGVDVRVAAAESLPFDDGVFGAALAQLVVHFMNDPVAGLREMTRVTREGGVVAACVWDHGGGEGPLSPYWEAVNEIDPEAEDESQLAGARKGHLTELFQQAGLDDVHESSISVTVAHKSFEEWWEPFTFGVGTAGAHLASLDTETQRTIRDRCAELLGPEPVITAKAWTARGRST